MQVSYATVPSPEPGRVNEDFVLAGPDWVVVLDGATAPAGVDSGCIHDVAWYVRHLAAALGSYLVNGPNTPLRAHLYGAIETVSHQHGGRCSLSNRASPSSTVAIVRQRGDRLDYLVLADSPIVIGNHVVVDERTAHLKDYSIAGVEAVRNRPGGFWVAQTDPEAADEALTGTVPVAEAGGQVALLTDGASRWVEMFKLGTWADLQLMLAAGPRLLIEHVRAAERATPPGPDPATGRRFKQHDDATAVFVTL